MTGETADIVYIFDGQRLGLHSKFLRSVILTFPFPLSLHFNLTNFR